MEEKINEVNLQISKLKEEIKSKEHELDYFNTLKKIDYITRELTRFPLDSRFSVNIVVDPENKLINFALYGGTFESDKISIPLYDNIVFVNELKNLIKKTINAEDTEAISIAKELESYKHELISVRFHTFDYDDIKKERDELKYKVAKFNALPWYKKIFFKFNK